MLKICATGPKGGGFGPVAGKARGGGRALFCKRRCPGGSAPIDRTGTSCRAGWNPCAAGERDRRPAICCGHAHLRARERSANSSGHRSIASKTLSPVGQLKPSYQLHAVWKVTPKTTAQCSRELQRRSTKSAQKTTAPTFVIGATLTRRCAAAERPRPANEFGWDV